MTPAPDCIDECPCPGGFPRISLSAAPGTLEIMNWFVLLGITVAIAAVAAVAGFNPKGTRSVAHSRLMTMGRLALLVIVILFFYMAFRARSGI